MWISFAQLLLLFIYLYLSNLLSFFQKSIRPSIFPSFRLSFCPSLSPIFPPSNFPYILNSFHSSVFYFFLLPFLPFFLTFFFASLLGPHFCGIPVAPPSGDLVDALRFCAGHPVETYGYALLFSLAGYVGVNFVLALVKSFGALIAVTVSTCRKALTIVLSFLFFAKPFSAQYVWSGILVIAGIYLNVYSKNPQTFHRVGLAVADSILRRLAGGTRKGLSQSDPADYV